MFEMIKLSKFGEIMILNNEIIMITDFNLSKQLSHGSNFIMCMES